MEKIVGNEYGEHNGHTQSINVSGVEKVIWHMKNVRSTIWLHGEKPFHFVKCVQFIGIQ